MPRFKPARLPYSELLKDPRWQKKRLEILERDGWECQNCGEKSKTLHVHHGRYQRGLDPWEYDQDILYTLCENCHSAAGAAMELIDFWLARCSPGSLNRLLGYIGAVAIESYPDDALMPCPDISAAQGIAEATGLVLDYKRPGMADEAIMAISIVGVTMQGLDAIRESNFDDAFRRWRASSRKVAQLMECLD